VAVNGNQPNQTFVGDLHRRHDHSVHPGGERWFTPQNFRGESDAVDLAYRDLANGTQDNRTVSRLRLQSPFETGQDREEYPVAQQRQRENSGDEPGVTASL